MSREHVLIVGASAAGLGAAEGLRAEGFTGCISLVGDEPHLPYDRPPLSKQYLSGTWDEQRLLLRDPAFLDALDAEVILGVSAEALDVEAGSVDFSTGESLRYDHLVIATGIRPILPAVWAGVEGVFTLRTRDDALRLRAALEVARSAVVVGAGFIGAEAASTCTQLGIAVTLVDPLLAPMVRALGPQLGEMLGDVHRDNGVTVRCGIGVSEVIALDGRVRAVRLSDGSELDADVIIVGIGSSPNVDWLQGSGLAIADGIECNEHCRAAPNVYAAGDVGSWMNRFTGTQMRMEHRFHATEQAHYVAQAIVRGAVEPFSPVPFFWSDQFDVRLQSHGYISPDDDVKVIDGSIADRRFVAAYVRAGRITGVVGVNMPKETRVARELVTGRPSSAATASTRVTAR